MQKTTQNPKFLAPFPEIYTPSEIQNKSRDEYIQGKKTGTVLTCNRMYHAPLGPPAICKSSQGVIWLVPYKITVSYPKGEKIKKKGKEKVKCLGEFHTLSRELSFI